MDRRGEHRRADDLIQLTNTTAVVSKAQQRLHLLRRLRTCHLKANLIRTFYCFTVESVLTYGITVSYTVCAVRDRKAMHGDIKSMQETIDHTSSPWSALQNLRGAARQTDDPSHPRRSLCNLLPSSRRSKVLRQHSNTFILGLSGFDKNYVQYRNDMWVREFAVFVVLYCCILCCMYCFCIYCY